MPYINAKVLLHLEKSRDHWEAEAKKLKQQHENSNQLIADATEALEHIANSYPKTDEGETLASMAREALNKLKATRTVGAK